MLYVLSVHVNISQALLFIYLYMYPLLILGHSSDLLLSLPVPLSVGNFD